jgi:transposase
MNEHQIRTRKSYTSEFKEQAVRLALELGNIEAASRQLDVGASLLGGWVGLSKAARDRGMGLADSIDEKSRNSVLERENANLRMENEILKKATAYFAAGHLTQSTLGFKSTVRGTR